MTGNELLRKLKTLGRQRRVKVEFVPARGKGSHGTCFFGERFAVIPDLKAELKTGTLHDILDQLGLQGKDIR